MISRTQKKKLDDLHAEITLKRNPMCIIAKLGKNNIPATDRHHVFGRAFNVRWLVENGQGIERFNHDHTVEMHEMCEAIFADEWGQERYDELARLAKKPCIRVDYEVIKDYLTEQLNSI